MAENNYTINHRTATLPDIQKDFMWQMLIPNVKTMLATDTVATDIEDLLVRCRSISIPQRTTEAITSSFMGTQQYYAGRVTPGGTVSVDFEDTEDMKIAQIFYEWQQRIFNTDPDADKSAGSSEAAKKIGSSAATGYSLPITLLMMSYNGTTLSKAITFHNAWVQNVADVALSYEGTGAVKYSVTFQFDYWTLDDSPESTD